MRINTKQIALKKPLFTRAAIYHSRTYKSSARFTSAAITIAALVNALPVNPKPRFRSIYKYGY